MQYLLLSSIWLLSVSWALAQQNLYTEPYRPQFHVSPSTGFMGDPNGPIKFDGQYHLFWWGHLVSDDLVFWEQLNTNALTGTPAGYGNWSGSVVVDTANTAGFNTATDTAMIAVYTLNTNATGVQQQALSVSLDHRTFAYYSGNPVLPGSTPDFRDPQVFWHAPTARWVMVITRPVERAIEIYTSPDLKTWTPGSTFRGRGAVQEVWEVPDLFELAVDGDPQTTRWVMTCGMGPNRMQYWVGDFDGTTFTLDERDNLLSGAHVEGEVFADWETGYGNWTASGEAFGNAPGAPTLPDQQEVSGYTGHQLVNSFHGGDRSTGSLVSPDFTIAHKFINFTIGGGRNVGSLGIRLIVGGREVARAANTIDAERMQWRSLDVSAYRGQTAHLEIVDQATGSWGHVLIDQIVFSDTKYDTRIENANWMDWGLDYYASKTFRNYDNDDDRTIGLAWMGNWAYARDVPTKPWQGNQSLPRVYTLTTSERGYQLKMKPIEALQQLRYVAYAAGPEVVSGTTVVDFTPTRNTYELKVAFRLRDSTGRFGIRLAKGTDQEVRVTFDPHTSNLTVDRTRTPFTYAGRTRVEVPVYVSQDSILDLHLFLDQSSLEVFAEDYEWAVSSLAFTKADGLGIELFTEGSDSVEVTDLEAWQLASIWEEPVGMGEPRGWIEPRFDIFPNPASDLLQLRYTGPENTFVARTFRVSDVNGRILFSGKLTDRKTVDLQALPSGAYVVVLEDGGVISARRFLKR